MPAQPAASLAAAPNQGYDISPSELAACSDLSELARAVGIDPTEWATISAKLGNPETFIDVAGMRPEDVLRELVQDADGLAISGRWPSFHEHKKYSWKFEIKC